MYGVTQAKRFRSFGVQSDDFVIEALPGGGWYTKIILPYVAENGRYAAANYAYDMFPLILPQQWQTPERMAELQAWAETFPATAAEFAPTAAPVEAFSFGSPPEAILGEADAFLFVRALHNFNRAGGDYMATALEDAYALLKPGGVVGVVQHRAAADAEGPAGDGSGGYMRQADVIALFENAGFVFEAESEINANPADQPAPGEVVWRLPPSYMLGDDGKKRSPPLAKATG